MTQIAQETRMGKAIGMAGALSGKTVVTTLLIEAKDTRQSGNTTRQVNFAIDQLFKGNAVVCLDHYEKGRSDRANMGLFERVLRRLQNEHPGLVSREHLGYNQLYGFIYLKT